MAVDSGPVTAVAIPARDEAAAIGPCLRALDAQRGAPLDHIVLFANNTRDDTVARARAVPLRPGTVLHVIAADLPPSRAGAGHARRIAVAAAARLAGPAGLVLTTDADGRADPDWLRNTRLAVAAGADAVAGWVSLDPDDAGRLPPRLHADDARECAYDALLDELAASLDPDPADPRPRHTQASGASLAVRVGALARAGGVPPLACGEDRALVAALRRTDARIRHAPGCHVIVSGRTAGRASGGMAETIARRLHTPDTHIDDRLEPAKAAARRARLRRALRLRDGNAAALAELARRAAVPADWLAATLRDARYFGEAWDALEARSPVLVRRRVAVADLARETATARVLLAALRAGAGPLGMADLAVWRAPVPA